MKEKEIGLFSRKGQKADPNWTLIGEIKTLNKVDRIRKILVFLFLCRFNMTVNEI